MNILKTVDLKGFGKKHSGKVRDFYIVGDSWVNSGQTKRILITTDRISAFDRVLDCIPYKGQVLNLLSKFWFENMTDIVPNHMISVPHANVTIAKNCVLIPIEMVVRGYMTGVTVTAIWPSYQRGERIIYGVKFPDGLEKNQKLPKPVITPTYHGDMTGKGGHDTRLTRELILESKIKLENGQIIDEKLYGQMEKTALAMFERGTKICAKAGIILVDTKYEFGLYDGKLLSLDEVHTPDSSRFWIKKTYKKRIKDGQEPENFDKEFLRLWFAERGYKGDGEPPKMPKEFINKVSERYIQIYEKITGKKFVPSSEPITEQMIQKALE